MHQIFITSCDKYKSYVNYYYKLGIFAASRQDNPEDTRLIFKEPVLFDPVNQS